MDFGFIEFRGCAAGEAKLGDGYCPRLKARGVNGGMSPAVSGLPPSSILSKSKIQNLKLKRYRYAVAAGAGEHGVEVLRDALNFLADVEVTAGDVELSIAEAQGDATATHRYT